MLQRKQTLFLLLASLATAATFLFPVATAAGTDAGFIYNNYGLYVMNKLVMTRVQDGFLYVAAAGVLLLLLFALSQFKRRTFQLKVCRVAYILILAQFALYFFIPEKALGKLTGGTAVSYDVAFYMPLVALVFTFLAEHFIKKDEKLVRSADRIR